MGRGGDEPQSAAIKVRRNVSYSDPGLPRPHHSWRPTYEIKANERRCPQLPDELPVPWINGPTVRDHDDWHAFRGDAVRAHHERLCAVCGRPLGQRILLGAMGGRQETAGPGGHPRCILIAVQRCPHLVEHETRDPGGTIAWEYVGDGVGYLIPDPDDSDYQGYDYLEEHWGQGEHIVPEARPLTLADVKQIARSDPWGGAKIS